MGSFLKRLIILGILVAVAWIPAKEFLDENSIGQKPSVKYKGDIREIDANQLYSLLKKGARRNSQTILLYVFNFKCSSCWINLEDVNEIAEEFKGEKLVVIALGISNRHEVARFLGELDGDISLIPFVLRKGDNIILSNRLKSLGTNYSKPPYLGIFHQDKVVTNLATGARRKNKIRAEIDRVIRN